MVGRLPLGAEGDDTAVGYRKGRWSAREAEICTARLREVLESAGLTPESDEFLRALRQPRRVGKAGSGDEDDEDAAGEARSQLFHGRRNSFWRELTDAVNASLEEEGLPPRKRKVVSDWVHNRFLGRNGPWSADETARLTAMRRGGAKWSDIAVELGRYVQDVRQKFQQTEPVARRGDWLEEEEAALGELVREAMKRAAEGQGLDAEALRATAAWMGGGGEGGAERDWCELGRPGAPTQAVDSLQRGLPWEAIATKLASETGSGRSAKQCRQKWTLGINPLVNAGRATGRFTEDLELVRRLHELGADDASDVSWASLVPSLDSRRAKERLQTLARRLDGFDGWVANGEVGEVQPRAACRPCPCGTRQARTLPHLPGVAGGRPAATYPGGGMPGRLHPAAHRGTVASVERALSPRGRSRSARWSTASAADASASQEFGL